MPGLLIKSVPPDLHLKLKQSASQHHRSMTKEALALLEKALEQEPTPAELPQPVRLKSPISGKWINDARLLKKIPGLTISMKKFRDTHA